MLWWTLHQLKSSKWQTRAEAATRLGASHQKKAAPALIEALADESDRVRIAAVNALGALRHPAASEPLALALAGLSRRARGSEGGAERVSPDAEYEALARALGEQGDAAVPPLLRLLDSDDTESRRWAAHALGLARAGRAVEPLIKRLADGRSDVRKAAALALGEIGDARALDALIHALGNRDLETRRAAAVALGTIGSDQAIDPLCALSADPNEPVQLAVVEALRKIGGVRAGLGLRTIIDGSKRNVHYAAEAALRSLKFEPSTLAERAAVAVLTGDFAEATRMGDASVAVLTEALGSKDASRRRQATEALGLLRSPAAIEPLLRALKDHDPAVQDAAARALAGAGKSAIAGLTEMLTHHDPAVQCLAARALGQTGDPDAVTALTGAIEQNRTISNEYRELLDVVRATAAALEAVLAKSAADMTNADLERIAAVPDAVHQSAVPEAGGLAFDCGPVRTLAYQELRRRRM